MFTRHAAPEPKTTNEPQRIDALRLQSLAPTPAGRAAAPTPPPVAATVPSAPPLASTHSGGRSIIGNDLTIIGQGLRIISKGNIQVDGEIQGDVLGAEVIIGQHGKVTGVVSAENITVCGEVQGTIRGVKVALQSSSRVEGDVHHQVLTVEEGAQLEGRIRRSQDVSELKPNLAENGSSAA